MSWENDKIYDTLTYMLFLSWLDYKSLKHVFKEHHNVFFRI